MFPLVFPVPWFGRLVAISPRLIMGWIFCSVLAPSLWIGLTVPGGLDYAFCSEWFEVLSNLRFRSVGSVVHWSALGTFRKLVRSTTRPQ